MKKNSTVSKQVNVPFCSIILTIKICPPSSISAIFVSPRSSSNKSQPFASAAREHGVSKREHRKRYGTLALRNVRQDNYRYQGNYELRLQTHSFLPKWQLTGYLPEMFSYHSKDKLNSPQQFW